MFCACVGLAVGLLFGSADNTPAPDPLADGFAFGTVSQYADGLMEQVVANRVAWGHISEQQTKNVDVFGAVLRCQHIGKRGRITWQDGQSESFLIVDCANPEHTETVRWMTENAVVIEVGFATAERWGFVGRGVTATIELD